MWEDVGVQGSGRMHEVKPGVLKPDTEDHGAHALSRSCND